ncbi:hypothetical protein LJE72_26035 [Desulfosporosinus sp. SRJS8]|nr:hypothetical protein [Desulfosporosinus sp. SRJS8]MCB8818906.1 hypothetical protein [Desulfosporosinus sp. SRJS8]
MQKIDFSIDYQALVSCRNLLDPNEQYIVCIMIEVGKFNPSLQLCIAICKTLGKTLNDIFWEV